MDQNKSFLLQKQVRDNSEDLQKELLGLKNWELEMKRKEAELLNTSDERIQILPPIRNIKKRTIESSPPIASTSKTSGPDRIKSADYSAWEKFDVDAACRKLDEENESDGSVEDVQETAEKKHAEATKFKDQGNIFVQKKLFNQAIKSYSEAIKLFPYDEVFYANRALCHLKIDNLYSAVADCTAALQLNDCYVKAYHRRATARMDLEEYKEAKEDIERILNLEPANKEAKLMLARVNKRLEKSKPLIISESTSPDCSVEKKIGEKIWNTAKLKEQAAIQKQQIVEIKKVKEGLKASGLKITEICNETEQELFEEKLPDWLPKLDDNYSIVKPIELSPHQRSQKPLKRIPIKNVDFGNTILPKYEDEESMEIEKVEVDEKKVLDKIPEKLINLPNPEKNAEIKKPKEDSTNVETKLNQEQTLVEKPEESIKHPSLVTGAEIRKPPKILQKLIQEKNLKEIKKMETPKIIEIIPESPKQIDDSVQRISERSDKKVKKKPLIEEISSSIEVPPTPKTSVQFLMDWKRNKSLDFRSSFLKQIAPEVIPKLFKDSMESNIFEDIIGVLKEEFASKERNVFQYLEQLSNVKRFRTLIMFIDKSTKEALKELFAHCKSMENKSEEDINELRRKYEL